MYFIEKNAVSKDFSYPDDYVSFVNSCRELERPWWLLGKRPNFTMRCFKILNEDLSSEKTLIPFAKSDDSGDIACFDGDDSTGNPKIYFYTGESDLRHVNWGSRYSIDSFSDFLSSIGN
ncbi:MULTISPECIES: SMI1/KNR4 family protein [Marinobacter]|uniref:SMI1/KNR4 family protein n=1 Tax=Marinobacter TaxID=2742 RepID=UPI001244186F|nr:MULTISPECIES: SMI1/KNR4 family protein [Marinobacter]MBL3557517.1 SMI1/KNR4 family protein [Marinobacter sp. JB05H06]